jgi:hypothetical protein
MAELLSPIMTAIWDSERVLTFKSTEELSVWATREREFWTVPDTELDGGIISVHREQVDVFTNVLNYSQRFDSALATKNTTEQQQVQQTIQNVLNRLATGTLLTTDTKAHRNLSRMRKTSANGFALLSILSRANGREVFNQQVSERTAIAILAPIALARPGRASDGDSGTYRTELAALLNSYQDEAHTLRTEVAELKAQRGLCG